MADTLQQERMHAYLGGICKHLNSPATTVGGVDDHVHLLVLLDKTKALADYVRELKRASSGWAKEHLHREFSWQSGYGAFSVGHSQVDTVVRYIGSQPDHHRRITFKEEFLELLRQHDMEWDERYIWS